MSRLKILRRDTISQKLTFITMSMAVAVLLMSTTVFVVIDMLDFRREMIEELSAQAEIVGHNCTAGIVFDDSSEVAQILSSLKARKNIVKAIVYLSDGSQFASYGEASPVSEIPLNFLKKKRESINTEYVQFVKNRLVVIRPIILEKEELGFIHIESNLEDLYHHIRLDLSVAFLFLLTAIPISFLLSRKLQKQFSDPIMSIVDIAKQVSLKKDFSIRAPKVSNDELGTLSDVLNEMLESIQERDAKLKKYAEGLEAEIIERKQVEKKLEILNRAIEQAAESVLITNSEGIIEYVNPSFEGTTEYKKKEVIGQTPRILKSDKQDEKYYKNLWSAIISGRNWKGTLINKKKSGELYNAEMTISPVKNEAGEVSHFVAIAHNITERIRAEEALRISEERLQSILDNTTNIVYLKDLKGKYLLINSTYENLFKITRKEILGKMDHDIFKTETADAFRENDLKVIKENRPLEFEEVAPSEDGPHTYISVKFPLHDSSGKPYGVCGISTDITERKKMEEALRDSEEKIRSIIDNSSSAIFLKDIEGKHLLVNNNFAAQFNATKEEITGKTNYDLFPREVADSILQKDQEVLKTKKPLEYEEDVVLHGEKRIYFSTKFPLLDSNGVVYALCGISTDITERKLVEEELRNSEERLRVISQQMPDALLLSSAGDPNDSPTIIEVNAAACEMHGYTREELSGRSLRILPDSESLKKMPEYLAEIKKGKTIHFETKHRRKDGTVFPVEVRTSMVKHKNKQIIISMMRDITERKQAEETLKNFARKLVESQENERKRIAGELHDSLAQDLLVINNELKTYIKSASVDPKELRSLKDASNTAMRMIDKIREISYDLRPPQLDKLGFKKGVESLVGRLSRASGISISADIKLRNFTIPPDIEINIFRIIQEGLSNVIKHSEAKSSLVKVLHKNNTLSVQISDEGKGFNPDSSSHKMHLKQGYGLQGINERVKLIGGIFILESTPNKGTDLNISIQI